MKRLSILIALFGLLITLTSCGTCSSKNYSNSYEYDYSYSKGDTQKSFDVKPGGVLDIDLNTGGSIKVIGWDKDVVDVDLNISGRDSEDVEYKFKQSGNRIKIYTDFEDDFGNHKVRIKVTVRVPKQFDVEFSTMGGGVIMENIDGRFDGKTMGGSLDLRDLKGDADLTTMGGSVDISNSDLDGEVTTMGGSVNLENVIGNVDTKTMGGSIRHDVKRRKNDTGSKSKVYIETMGGNIDVTDAPYGAKVKTMGGNIHIVEAEKFVDALTMGGDIRIDKVDGSVKTKTMGGNIKCRVIDNNSGSKDINLTSMSGDIELYVPDNFSADIDIEIKYDRRSEGDFEIVSDFDIDTKVRKEHRRNRVLCGNGTSGNGKNKIKIKTVNGSVYLKKK